MDQLIIERKLDSLQRCVNRIASKCPQNPQTLVDDVDLQDIVVLNLSRAIQLCVDIGSHCLSTQATPVPNTMGEIFDSLAQNHLIELPLAERLKKAVGFRNLAVHNYAALDISIVHTLATKHLDDFKTFIRAIASSIPAK